MLQRASTHRWPYYALKVDPSAIVGLLDAVRTAVLQWAIDLERSGITGTEFSFSNEEKTKAQGGLMSITTGAIGTFFGNMGSANTTRDISVGSIDIKRTADLASEIRRFMPHLVDAGVNQSNLIGRLEIIEAEIAKPEPSHGLLRAALVDVRNLVSSAGGSIAASGVLELIKGILN